MKPLDIDIPLAPSRVPKYLGSAVAAVALAGAFMYGGFQVHAAMNPPKLPANQQCIASNQATKEAAKAFSVQLVAALDGVDAPAPDLSKVKAASLECKATADQVTVKVEAQK